MDQYLFRIMQEHKKNDNSFKERSLFGLPIKYKQSEVREIWFQGIELGIEKGLRLASLEGQRIETNTNMQNQRHKEFYEKFLKLASDYNCCIQYHPMHGIFVNS